MSSADLLINKTTTDNYKVIKVAHVHARTHTKHAYTQTRARKHTQTYASQPQAKPKHPKDIEGKKAKLKNPKQTNLNQAQQTQVGIKTKISQQAKT